MTTNRTPLSESTVLVTGGAGFIGGALSQQLSGRVARFVTLDNLHPQVHPERRRPGYLHPSAELVVGDVTDERAWDDILARYEPSIVIHCAAETGTAQSLSEASRHAETNVVGTTRMLDAFTRLDWRPDHIVLSSSRAVYGDGMWQRPDGSTMSPGQRPHSMLAAGQWDHNGATALPSVASRTPPDPTSIYGATKLAQEHILAAWCRAKATRLTILRLQNVYGPGQSLTNAYTGIVALFSQLARQGSPIPLYEDGMITRDFVYIDDVARAFVAALTASSPEFTTLDIGSGSVTTIDQLARLLASYYNAPAPYVTGQFRDGDVRHASCDISESVRTLDWSAEWQLASGIDALQKWLADELS